MAATGATSLVAAPATGTQIAVDAIHITYTTDTSSRIDIYLRPTDAAAASGQFRTLSNQTLSAANNAVAISKELDVPWLLDSATSLQAVLSVTAASTPGAHIAVRYRLVVR